MIKKLTSCFLICNLYLLASCVPFDAGIGRVQQVNMQNAQIICAVNSYSTSNMSRPTIYPYTSDVMVMTWDATRRGSYIVSNPQGGQAVLAEVVPDAASTAAINLSAAIQTGKLDASATAAVANAITQISHPSSVTMLRDALFRVNERALMPNPWGPGIEASVYKEIIDATSKVALAEVGQTTKFEYSSSIDIETNVSDDFPGGQVSFWTPDSSSHLGVTKEKRPWVFQVPFPTSPVPTTQNMTPVPPTADEISFINNNSQLTVQEMNQYKIDRTLVQSSMDWINYGFAEQLHLLNKSNAQPNFTPGLHVESSIASQFDVPHSGYNWEVDVISKDHLKKVCALYLAYWKISEPVWITLQEVPIVVNGNKVTPPIVAVPNVAQVPAVTPVPPTTPIPAVPPVNTPATDSTKVPTATPQSTSTIPNKPSSSNHYAHNPSH